jgi:paraquat-inducible protein B
VQSILTGLLMINLDFMPDTPVRLVGTDPQQLEIPTVPTALEELTRKIEKLPIEQILNGQTFSLGLLIALLLPLFPAFPLSVSSLSRQSHIFRISLAADTAEQL